MVDNDFNRAQYEAHAGEYLQSNTEGKIGGRTPEDRVKLLQAYLPAGRKIFEIGSGGGKDALALQQAGYAVTASEFVDSFVAELQNKGLQTVKFDAKNDELPEGFDAIYANAVFVHFSPDELKEFLGRANDNLNNERILFMSVIKGDVAERSARSRGFDRDFQYYQLPQLKELLEDSGYSILFNDDSDKTWIQLVCQAKEQETVAAEV